MKKLKKVILIGSIPFALLSAVVTTASLTGCAAPTGTGINMTQEGLVLTIAPSDINNFLKSQFPIEKEETLGKVILEDAKVESIETKDKLKLGVDAKYDPPSIIPAVDVGVEVEGGIKYEPKDKTIYLKDPLVDKIKFMGNTFSIPSFAKPYISSFVTEVFGKIPLYKFSQANLAAYLIKDVKVENGKIVVKFGL
jgi:hypothetical protein